MEKIGRTLINIFTYVQSVQHNMTFIQLFARAVTYFVLEEKQKIRQSKNSRKIKKKKNPGAL